MGRRLLPREDQPLVTRADIGISLPGTGEDPRAPVYIDGALSQTLRGDTIALDFAKLLDEYVERKYGPGLT